MRSGRSASVLVATLPLAGLLTGCVSTQTIAARARLVDARILASQSATVVTRQNPEVSVGRLALIHAPAGTALVVTLRNNSSTTLTDLPISVGIDTGAGRSLYLNRAANLDYFESHVAAIAAHAATTWVFTTARRTAGGRAFAIVGFSQLHTKAPPRLPPIEVSPGPRGSRRASTTVEASVANRSGIPQYALQVYAVAVVRGREVAAGRATVARLGTSGSTNVTVTLLGGVRQSQVRLIALPTIFS